MFHSIPVYRTGINKGTLFRRHCCGFGFVPNADPDPGSKINWIRILILVRLSRRTKLDFDMEIILYEGNMS